jgi:murein DD-endopeptidase MepM/ murein hydrolase activator NlpD
MIVNYLQKNYRFLALLLLVSGCSPHGPLTFFQKLSPHDQYAERLKSAGLDHTGMGAAWLAAATTGYANARDISLPYKEVGYFAASQVRATGLRFQAKRGQLITMTLNIRPAGSFILYADLAQVQQDRSLKAVAFADSIGLPFSYEIKKTGAFILRLQPELLRGGEYALTVTTGPSLKFPVAIGGRPRIESFWGDSRDNGGRRHEGIDVFAPKGTPALAAYNGTVTNVTLNKLGGKVIFIRPDKEDYTLYYAHLGAQLVHDGQRVSAGDTVGLIDNTGNAKTTPSHLHFGIYTSDGAVDPLPFVDRRTEQPSAIRLSLARLNDTLVVSRRSAVFKAGEPVIVLAATGEHYLVESPGGHEAPISGEEVRSMNILHKTTLRTQQALYDRPDTAAARISQLKAGSVITVVATYQSFELIRFGELTGWRLSR